MILYGLNLEVDTYCLEDKENMEQSPKLKDKYLVGDIYLRWTIRTLVGLGLLPRLTYLCQLIYLFAKLPYIYKYIPHLICNGLVGKAFVCWSTIFFFLCLVTGADTFSEQRSITTLRQKYV